jgi:hypothetical protein
VDIKFDLAKFVDDTVPNTPFSYPFGIVLPTYLPPSVTLENSKITGLKAQICYRVTASFDKSTDPALTVSKDVQILRPHPQP